MERAISSFDNVSSHGDHATYAQYILASDDALRDCVLLIRDRTPLRQWPTRLRLAMNLALRQSCDDTDMRQTESAHVELTICCVFYCDGRL